MRKKRKILYAVLNWGLGHATRSLPVIRKLVKENDVTIMSTGRSLRLLRSELPGADFIDHEDYSVKYTKKGGALLFSLLFQLPKILLKLREEHRFTEKLIREKGFDRIVSDNRYGIYSKEIPSYFITHQLRFKLPKGLEKLEILSEIFNKLYFRRYRKIFIPDEKNEPNLSGYLSHNIPGIKELKLYYTGIMADILKSDEPILSDRLIIISGPEPQRTIFEEKAIEQSESLDGKTIIVCGKTERDDVIRKNGVEIYSHVLREKLSAMIAGTDLVISRPGYSSVMEIVSQGKKALFIPTPGQTEQEYLGRFLIEKGYFYSVDQNSMDLIKDIKSSRKMKCSISLKANQLEGMIDEILS